MELSYLKNIFAEPQTLELSLDELVELLKNHGHTIATKEGPLIVGATFSPDDTGRVARSLACLEKITCVILDVDGGDLQAARRGIPYCKIIYNTYNDGTDNGSWRFRIIVPLSRAVDTTEHRRLWYYLNDLIGGVADAHGKDVVHAWYTWRIKNPKSSRDPYLYYDKELPILDVDKTLQELPPPEYVEHPTAVYEYPITRFDIQQALDVIPACDYETWFKVGAGLHHWSGGDSYGLELFDRWSRKCGPDCHNKYSWEAVLRQWRAYRDTCERPITLRTVFAMARERGFEPHGIRTATIHGVPIPQLPPYAQIPDADDLRQTACPWLEEFINWSRKWSPRGIEALYEATGLFVLSTVAARRVVFTMGRPQATQLYFATPIRTTMFAKTTTTGLGKLMLQKAGLSFLLLPDSVTPQKLLSQMSNPIPTNYETLEPELKAYFRKRAAFAGQQGWYYDEFGQQLASLMRSDSIYADLKRVFLKFYEYEPAFAYSTIARGEERITRPYMSVMANLTFEDIRDYVAKPSALWRTGFWARFIFITPSPNEISSRARYPREEFYVPQDLVDALREWHKRLGCKHEKSVIQYHNNRIQLNFADWEEEHLDIHESVWEAYYNYDDGLRDIIQFAPPSYPEEQFDGSYGRLPEKAMRVAALCASISDDRMITMRHWRYAQSVAERWRTMLHFIKSYGTQKEQSPDRQLEDRILALIQRYGPLTLNHICHAHITAVPRKDVRDALHNLAEAGLVEVLRKHRTELYALAPKTHSTRKREP